MVLLQSVSLLGKFTPPFVLVLTIKDKNLINIVKKKKIGKFPNWDTYSVTLGLGSHLIISTFVFFLGAFFNMPCAFYMCFH